MYFARCAVVAAVLLAAIPGLAAPVSDDSAPGLSYISPAEGGEFTLERLLRDHAFFAGESLPNLKVVRKALRTQGSGSSSGVEASSILGSTTVEYRTGVGLGLGVSSDTAWSLSQSVRIAPHVNVGVYFMQSMDPASTGAVRSVTAPAAQTTVEEPTQQVQLRLSWEF